jgi:hypothetical protein
MPPGPTCRENAGLDTAVCRTVLQSKSNSLIAEHKLFGVNKEYVNQHEYHDVDTVLPRPLFSDLTTGDVTICGLEHITILVFRSA